jgi:PEP-CTERM motif
MRSIFAATTALVLAAAVPAHATVVLTFGQTESGRTIAATPNADDTVTTLTGTDVPVTITQIMADIAQPIDADLRLNATSTGPAGSAGGIVTQAFSGTFLIAAGAINFLSGSFTDAVFGSGSDLTLTVSNAAPGEAVSLTSGVIPLADLAGAEAISLSFANVTPPVSIAGQTLGGFTSSISGDFSASVPEPMTLALLGLGICGLGAVRRRWRKPGNEA